MRALGTSGHVPPLQSTIRGFISVSMRRHYSMTTEMMRPKLKSNLIGTLDWPRNLLPKLPIEREYLKISIRSHRERIRPMAATGIA